tara:strand:+ start:3791 stop:4036 length:246 start_codon:yes stop_codon:yes gene_type:complete
MNYIIISLVSFLCGLYIGRVWLYKIKNYGVTKKMFLTLEIGEIDRKIEIALDLEDYELAFYLKRKMDRLERRLERIKRIES